MVSVGRLVGGVVARVGSAGTSSSRRTADGSRSGGDDPVAPARAWPGRAPGRPRSMSSSIGWSAWRATATPTDTLTARDAETRAGPAPPTAARTRSPTSSATSGRRVAQQDHELLAAVAGRDVVLADGRDDRAADRAQDLVAGRVTVRVVEDLELVDVDHQDADRVARAAAPGEQAAELVEVAPVRQAGQGVGRGLRLGGAMRVGTRQRRRRLDGGAVEQPPSRSRTRRPPSGATGRSRR